MIAKMLIYRLFYIHIYVYYFRIHVLFSHIYYTYILYLWAHSHRLMMIPWNGINDTAYIAHAPKPKGYLIFSSIVWRRRVELSR